MEIDNMKKITMILMLIFSTTSYAQVKLLDVLYLNPKVDPTLAISYFNKVKKIGKKHGLKLVEMNQVTGVMKGQLRGIKLVGIWKMKDKSVLKKLRNDSAYKKLTKTRDSIFNMKKSTILVLNKKI